MSPLRSACLLFVMLAAAEPLMAQAMRDPTMPPHASGASASGRDTSPNDNTARALLFIDGKPHLVAGARLYAEGQQLGAARVERITETEVWLREGGKLRKVSIYPSVRRRSVTPGQEPCAPDAATDCRDGRP